MAYIELIAGLIVLVIAGDILVRGSVAIAQKLGVPTLVIGLTLVAFGTSAPELVVGIDAVLTGAPNLALGNVVGSNIANVLLVVGIPAMILPAATNLPKLGRNIGFMLGASVIVIGLSFTGAVTFWNGVVLTGLLLAFLLYSARPSRPLKPAAAAAEHLEAEHTLVDADLLSDIDLESSAQLPSWRAALYIIAGLAGLIFGADWLVSGAVTIARSLGVSEAVIGLTLVAVGTSLPELVTGVAAAIHKHNDVALGNVLGSNIFNLLGILGITSLVGDLPVPASFLAVDLWVMLGAALLIVPPYLMKRDIGRLYGFGLVVLYIVYLVYLTFTGDAAASL